MEDVNFSGNSYIQLTCLRYDEIVDMCSTPNMIHMYQFYLRNIWRFLVLMIIALLIL